MALDTNSTGLTIGEFGSSGQVEFLNGGSSTTPSTLRREITHLHEVGTRQDDNLLLYSEQVIEPSKLPTIVAFRSSVTGGSQTLKSDAYLASVRRRQANALAKDIEHLRQHEDRQDFAVFTMPITEKLRQILYKTLVDAEHEGNSREIFRRLRDTFLNGGWEAYRAAEVREAAISILRKLGQIDEVTPKDVESVRQQFVEKSLQFIAVGPFNGEEYETEEIPD